MIDSKNIALGSHKGSEQDYIDKVDMAIRVQLNMCRQMKQRMTVRNKVLRNLGSKERARVSLVLEKVQLPDELLELEENVMEPESNKEVTSKDVQNLELVPFEEASAPKANGQLGNGPGKSALQSAEGFGILALPPVFQRLSQQGVGDPKPAAIALPEKPSMSGTCVNQEVLAKAMAFVPAQVHQSGAKAKGKTATAQQKSVEQKKQPKAKTQAKKKTKKKHPKKKPATVNAAKKLVPKEKKPAPKAKAGMVGAKSKLSLDDVPLPGNGSFTFESITFGTCKLEMYKDKSYLRHLVDGKYKNIIGSCVTGHHAECCRRLAPYVAQGKSSDELYQIRSKIIEALMDVE